MAPMNEGDSYWREVNWSQSDGQIADRLGVPESAVSYMRVRHQEAERESEKQARRRDIFVWGTVLLIVLAVTITVVMIVVQELGRR